MTYQELWKSLTPRYEDGEAKAIARMVLEVRFGLSLTDITCGKVNELSANNCQSLTKMFESLREGVPVQYMLGQTEFDGHVFQVAPGVLIPRSETADLVDEVAMWLHERRQQQGQDVLSPSLLDIGTGSGCIAISLSLRCPWISVSAWDVSGKALTIASGNAHRLGARVSFAQHDALCLSPDKAKWDVIVSNPPYITMSEKKEMDLNVLDYEPHEALFVPDTAPLLFFQAIASYATTTLREGGLLAFEINPLFADDVASMLRVRDFEDVRIVDDRYGRRRLALAVQPKPTL